MLRFITEKMKGVDLTPGDRFSTSGPDYWDTAGAVSVAEKVYIFTGVLPDTDRDLTVFRITTEWDAP